MMNEKIFAEEILLDEELEEIVGGASAYIYFASGIQNGKKGFIALRSTTPFASKQQVIDAYNKSVALLNGNATETTHGYPIGFVSEERAADFVNYGKSKGYDFIDVNTMK